MAPARSDLHGRGLEELGLQREISGTEPTARKLPVDAHAPGGIGGSVREWFDVSCVSTPLPPRRHAPGGLVEDHPLHVLNPARIASRQFQRPGEVKGKGHRNEYDVASEPEHDTWKPRSPAISRSRFSSNGKPAPMGTTHCGPPAKRRSEAPSRMPETNLARNHCTRRSHEAKCPVTG